MLSTGSNHLLPRQGQNPSIQTVVYIIPLPPNT